MTKETSTRKVALITQEAKGKDLANWWWEPERKPSDPEEAKRIRELAAAKRREFGAERLAKAEAKRARKQEKNLLQSGGNMTVGTMEDKEPEYGPVTFIK